MTAFNNEFSVYQKKLGERLTLAHSDEGAMGSV
jgi:hypothetical protein